MKLDIPHYILSCKTQLVASVLLQVPTDLRNNNLQINFSEHISHAHFMFARFVVTCVLCIFLGTAQGSLLS